MNYYQILGVSINTSQEDIRAAFHNLALKWHPDKNLNKEEVNREESVNKFKKISEAYKCLSNLDRKQEYDKQFSFEPQVRGQTTTSRETGYYNNSRSTTYFDNQTKKYNQDPYRRTTNVQISKRTYTPLHTQASRSGYGYSRPIYNWSRQTERESKASVPDLDTAKTIKVIQKVEATLEQLYYGEKEREYEIYIPKLEITKNYILPIWPGWTNGNSLTINDKIKDRDVEITFQVVELPHTTFKRKNNDLYYYLTSNATTDKELEIIHLDGEFLQLDLDGLGETFTQIRMKGKGMPYGRNGTITGYGDLIVTHV